MENQDAGANEGMAAELNGDVSKPAPQPSVDERLQKILDKALYADGRPEAQKLRNFLNGTWLGEPLHAALNGDVSKPAPQPSVDERLQKILDKALYADG